MVQSVIPGRPRRPGRRPQDPDPRRIPFKEHPPLSLEKNKVSGKSGGLSNAACIHEMTLMLNCFKSHEFDQANCGPEIQAFKACYVKHLETKSQIKMQAVTGAVAPGSSFLEHRQLNKLLKKFPCPK